MLRLDVRIPRRGLTVDVAFDVAPGTTLALTGPSGAGKSSVLTAITGLAPGTRGRIACGDDVWLDSTARRDVAPERRGCGVVFQDGALFPHLSVRRNVAYGLRSVARAERDERVIAALAAFGVAHLADARPSEISGGERRRVALARALAPGPHTLLLDEPLSALDRRSADDAARALSGVLAEAAGPAVLVTHDFAQASILADEVAVMDHGRIVQRGTPQQLVAAPATAFVAELTGAAVLAGTGHVRGDGLTDVVLAGGARIVSAGALDGPVAVIVRPWDVSLEPAGATGESSARNRLAARVTGLTPLGGRVRVGLALPEPLAAEVTADAERRLGLRPGTMVTATFKATATRLVPRAPAPDDDGST